MSADVIKTKRTLSVNQRLLTIGAAAFIGSSVGAFQSRRAPAAAGAGTNSNNWEES
jgi:hypothetical protein